MIDVSKQPCVKGTVAIHHITVSPKGGCVLVWLKIHPKLWGEIFHVTLRFPCTPYCGKYLGSKIHLYFVFCICICICYDTNFQAPKKILIFASIWMSKFVLMLVFCILYFAFVFVYCILYFVFCILYLGKYYKCALFESIIPHAE